MILASRSISSVRGPSPAEGSLLNEGKTFIVARAPPFFLKLLYVVSIHRTIAVGYFKNVKGRRI